MTQNIQLPSAMKISGDSMQSVERGLKLLAEINDAADSTVFTTYKVQFDASFAKNARNVAREITLIANRVKSHPTEYINVLRKYIGEDAAKAVAPQAYGLESQWQSLAAKLVLSGIDRALLRAA